MRKTSIYKTESAKTKILNLYQQKLNSLTIDYTSQTIKTTVGDTNVIIAGQQHLPPLVLFHGINAGIPMALEPIQHLSKQYCIYGIDTIGQTNRSAETRLPLKGDSYGKWIVEVLDNLNLKEANFIGVSYGAYLLQRLIAHAPKRIQKAIFVVPSGFANGAIIPSITKLMLPLNKFKKSKKEEDLIAFMDAFYETKDSYSVDFQRTVLLGVHMDMRRPPLISTKDTINFDAPVYILGVDNDIFFPIQKVIKRAEKVFKTSPTVKILPNAKHVPDRKDYATIEQIILGFLEDEE